MLPHRSPVQSITRHVGSEQGYLITWSTLLSNLPTGHKHKPIYKAASKCQAVATISAGEAVSPASVVGTLRLPGLTHHEACCDMALDQLCTGWFPKTEASNRPGEFVNSHQGVTVTSPIYGQHTSTGSQAGTVGRACADEGLHVLPA